jgi:hypothetical protein
MSVRSRVRVRVLALGAVAAAHAGLAQDVNPAPIQAKSLVVRIHAIQTGGNAENGAGVIIAADQSAIYVLTARHVVAKETVSDTTTTFVPVDSAWVAFFQGSATDSSRAEVILLDSGYLATDRARFASARQTRDTAAIARARTTLEQDSVLIAGYDLAVLRIARRTASLPPSWTAPQLDRLGDPHAEEYGDAVSPIGCPRSACWIPPVPADRLVTVQPGEVVFQTVSVAPGSSGGALFNDLWEVIGIVTATRTPRATAIPINEAVGLLQRAGIPVQLRAARLPPRNGYHTTFELSLLAPGSAAGVPDSLAVSRRLPSGRLTLSWRGRSALTWHVSALRLAPYNTAVNAALGGIGYTLRVARFSAQPFAELGLGSVNSRYDRGGYYVLPKGATSSATSGAYVPLWTLESLSGVGVGGGLALEYVVAPQWSITANVARWSFGQTPNAPAFPGFFSGGGLRWSR